MKKKPRPQSDAQRIAVIEALLKDYKVLPSFCPVCGGSICSVVEEMHEYGSDYVRQFMGLDCATCGQLTQCVDCEGWHSERWDEELPPEDCRPYLCDCPSDSDSAFVLGTLSS